jgi:hypothetical protein
VVANLPVGYKLLIKGTVSKVASGIIQGQPSKQVMSQVVTVPKNTALMKYSQRNLIQFVKSFE